MTIKKGVQPLSKVVSLTAWFKLPEQGMQQFDVLSQASALPVISNNSLVFLTSQHVVLPWLYRHYYMAEWLDFVKPQHTVYTIECREGNGAIAAQFRLDPNSIYRHPKRDVVSLSLCSEEQESMFKNNPTFDGLVKLSDQSLNKTSPVTVAGYEIAESLYNYDEVDDNSNLDSVLMRDYDHHNGFRDQVPVNMEGCYFSDTVGQQNFLKTPSILIEGMCGGGVFSMNEHVSQSTAPLSRECVDSKALCHGIIEGIVPLNTPSAPQLAGHASYIDSVTLLNWLRDRRV